MEEAIINLFNLPEGEEARMVGATDAALYFVTNWGREFSISAKVLSPTKGYTRIRNGSSYLYGSIGKKKISMHRLVATAFIPNPDHKPEINHINGNKYDNRAENLEWVTSKENKRHAWKEGLMHAAHKPQRKNSIVKAAFDDVLINGLSYNAAAQKYGMTYSSIAATIHRERKGDYTFLRDMYPNIKELLDKRGRVRHNRWTIRKK